jgi:hypothetical protein
VEETKKDHRPREPGEFPLELLTFANACVGISFGRPFGSHKTHSYTQAHGSTYGGVSHFREQVFVAGFAENPFVAWFWRFSWLVDRNGIKPDKTCTDGTAYGFVPAASLFCSSPGGDRCIISWHHNFVRSFFFAGALHGFSRKDTSSL